MYLFVGGGTQVRMLSKNTVSCIANDKIKKVKKILQNVHNAAKILIVQHHCFQIVILLHVGE